MNKRRVHYWFNKLRTFSAWYFFLAAVICFSVAVITLRNNNLTAVRLRADLLAVDKQNGDVNAALNKLRLYMYSHMNTDLSAGGTIRPPVQLKYSYERLVTAEKDRVSKANAAIYNQAQKECERLFPVGLSGSGRIPCITDFVSKYGQAEQPIEDALYKFDFISPTWSPDLAGLSLLFGGLFTVLFVVRLILQNWLKNYLSQHA